MLRERCKELLVIVLDSACALDSLPACRGAGTPSRRCGLSVCLSTLHAGSAGVWLAHQGMACHQGDTGLIEVLLPTFDCHAWRASEGFACNPILGQRLGPQHWSRVVLHSWSKGWTAERSAHILRSLCVTHSKYAGRRRDPPPGHISLVTPWGGPTFRHCKFTPHKSKGCPHKASNASGEHLERLSERSTGCRSWDPCREG